MSNSLLSILIMYIKQSQIFVPETATLTKESQASTPTEASLPQGSQRLGPQQLGMLRQPARARLYPETSGANTLTHSRLSAN